MIVFILLLSLSVSAAQAGEHTVERGETALQIAIDHNLTMAQLQQINPDKDLEMMLVGDSLIVPDPGFGSFEDFLNEMYGKRVKISGLHCDPAADRHAMCFFYAENLFDLPLFDVSLRAEIRDENGTAGESSGSIALIQILPGEKLPIFLEIPGSFGSISQASVSVLNLSWSEQMQSSFRIPEDAFSLTDSCLPDRTGVTSRISFTDTGIESYSGRMINVLASAYDAEGQLTGIRSLYTEFRPQIEITVYSNNIPIESVSILMEAY